MSDFDAIKWIKRAVKCCACMKTLRKSKHINVVVLHKQATWKFPVWGNILVMNKYPINRASAILCDDCIKEGRTPEYAVEWDNEHTYVRYHPVDKLKDLPPIPEEEILEAEARLYDFGGGDEVMR